MEKLEKMLNHNELVAYAKAHNFDGILQNVNREIFSRDEYKKFMYDPANICKCRHCPENGGFSEGPNYNRLPCGQYHCWVAAHCK